MDTRTPTPMLHVAAAIVGGLFLAVFLGQAAAQGSISKIGMVLVLGPILVLLLGLQSRVWLIIPFLGAFGGSIPPLPLPFAVRELAIMASFGVFVALAIFKKLPKRANYDILDILLLLNLLYMLTVYMRNPVGVRAFGSDMVGGRPYFMVLIACMSYWVFCHVSVGPRLAFVLPLIGLAGSFVAFGIWLFSYLVPPAGRLMGKFYTGVDFGTVLAEYSERPAAIGGDNEGFVRLGELGSLGAAAILCLLAYYRPITLLAPVYFGRFCAFIVSALAMLMGGFRGLLFSSGIYFLIATYFRGGIIDVFRASIIGVGGVILLVAIHVSGLRPLPSAMQRALSALPIPIEWDRAATGDAGASSSWRFQMWHELLTEDQWIKNKLLGDGFGFSAEDLRLMYGEMLGSGGFMGEQGAISQKISGAYHNGPLSTIRFVGVVGLLLYLPLMFAVAARTIKLIRLTAGSPYYPLAVLKIPAIFAPVVFLFIFGGYDSDVCRTIAFVGGLKMISRSYQDYLTAQRLEQAAKDAAPVAKEPEPVLIAARSFPSR